MRLYPGLLAFAALLPACAQRTLPQQAAASQPAFQKPRTVSTIPINTAPGDTALVYQRTPCYGTCPVYTATIFRNGQVSYAGDRFVPVTGQHNLNIAQPTVQEMLEGARHINFTQLRAEYRANVSDLPGTVVTVYLPGQKRHRVLAERGAAPTELQNYLNYLQGKLDPLAGINVER